jgi:serine/threonine-protein kinase
MSPEQVSGMRADHRSDLFSLGIVIYELAAGAPPFAASDVTQLMHRIATATQLPPSSIDSSLPPMLDLIIAKALKKDPGARYQSAGELATDLRACLADLRDDRGASADNTVQVLDTGYAETATMPLGQATTEPNVAPDATPARSRAADVAIDSGAPVYLSRRFDSSLAVERLARLAAPIGAGAADARAASLPSPGLRKASFGARAVTLFERLRQDAGLRNAVIAFLVAAVVALIIAFL